MSEKRQRVIRKSGHRLSVRSCQILGLDGRLKGDHGLFDPML